MRRLAGLLMFVLCLLCASAPAQVVRRIHIFHADPTYIMRMLAGVPSWQPEYSVICYLQTANGFQGQGWGQGRGY